MVILELPLQTSPSALQISSLIQKYSISFDLCYFPLHLAAAHKYNRITPIVLSIFQSSFFKYTRSSTMSSLRCWYMIQYISWKLVNSRGKMTLLYLSMSEAVMPNILLSSFMLQSGLAGGAGGAGGGGGCVGGGGGGGGP